YPPQDRSPVVAHWLPMERRSPVPLLPVVQSAGPQLTPSPSPFGFVCPSSYDSLCPLLSSQNGTAIHVQHLTRDKARHRCTKEQHRAGNLCGRCDAPDRNSGPDLRTQHWVSKGSGGHVGCNPSGSHTIHKDSARRQLTGQALGETDESAFGHGIVCMQSLAALPCCGADENNVAFRTVLSSWRWALKFHLHNGRLHESEDGVEVDGDGATPLFFRHQFNGSILGWPYSVIDDKGIETPESLNRSPDQSAPIRGRAQLLLDRNAAARATALVHQRE